MVKTYFIYPTAFKNEYLAEICNHFLHQRFHRRHVDYFELVCIDGPIQVNVFADFTKNTE